MSLWLKTCILLLFTACIDSMQWREPTSWTFMGVLDGHDYSRGSRSYFWKPNCPHGFLRIGDAVTSENIIPTGIIACVFGQDYEITPISHDMMTLIYDPANSELLFYRGFAPGPVAMLGTMVTTTASFTPDVGRGKRSVEDVQELDPNLQFYAAFIGPCLGTHQWCELTSRFESSGQNFIIGFNPFEWLHFSMPGSLFLPSSNPNPSILGCLAQKCACGGCVHGNCTEDGRCDCHPQWMGLSCDKDINECATGTSQCDPLTECINEMGGYTCGPCPPGFKDVNSNGTLCEDIDECADPALNDCASLGLNCTNLPGRFQCTDCEIGSYRPTPGSQCRFQSCGNGKWDDKEECDGGLGCFANNCTCSPLWEPTNPRSPDCQRRCGNHRLDLPEEQCDGGEGCRAELCICNTGRGYQPINSTSCGFRLTDPEDILCARLSSNGCDECTQFNCIWCPNEEISCVPRSRPTGGCTTSCSGAVVIPTPGDDAATESLNKIILIISLVGAAVIVIAGIGIGVLVIYRRRKRLKRLEEERLLDLERKRMAAVSKYGIARSEVGQSVTGEWNPPDDSSLILVEQLPFTMSKAVFDFHNGENQFKVNSLYLDRFTISLKDKVPKPPKKQKKMDEDKVPLVGQTEHKKRSGEADEVHFVFHNVDSHKYRLEFMPNSGYLKKGKDLDITVTMEVKMTTEVELVAGIELPDYHQHSFVMSPITSELSSFIDLDEIQLDSRKPLGDGAFGIVYKGFYRGQDVAVKILKMQDMPEEMLDEFDREIDLMNKLRHKNIVQFIGASKVVGKLAIVTEFIEFGNCHHLLHQTQKPLEFDFKVKIALDAARAIRFLHQNNILHRDIKPDNLLIVSLDGHAPVAAKLTDFGTSRAVSKLSNQYTTGIGTPSYMAPEILGKKPYDTKADVYSFGILLWSLYTQKEPYLWIEHSWEVAQYVLEGKREIIPADCPSLYAQLIEGCWAHDPEQRPAMEAVISALENIVKMSKFWTGM